MLLTFLSYEPRRNRSNLSPLACRFDEFPEINPFVNNCKEYSFAV